MQPEEIPENLYLQVDDLNRRFVDNFNCSMAVFRANVLLRGEINSQNN